MKVKQKKKKQQRISKLIIYTTIYLSAVIFTMWAFTQITVY